MSLAKIMLVGSKIPPALMKLLLDCGSRVTRISTGKTAVAHAQREMFDAAIIVSTGAEMDVAETVFNLSDINKAMQFILVAGRTKASEPAIPKDSLQRVIPNTKVMTLQELRSYLTKRRHHDEDSESDQK